MKLILVRAVMAIIGLLALSSAARATPITIDFESLAGTGTLFGANESYAANLDIDGFTFSTNAGFGFRSALSNNANYTGSVALVANEANASVTLSQTNNALFDIASIGLVFSNLAQQNSADLTFYGTKADSSVVAQTFAIDNTLTTYNFNSSFSGLQSLTWTQLQAEGNNHQFDNVVVDGDPSSVPEPSSAYLLLLALAGTALQRKRQKLATAL